MKEKPAIFGLIVLLIALTVYLLYLNFKPSSSTPLLQTASVLKGNLIVTISSSGSIISGASTNVETQASGLIKKIYVQEGQKVKKGDKLIEIQLDQPGIQNRDKLWSQYLAAKIALANAKAKQYALQSTMFSDNQLFMNYAVTRHLPSSDPIYVQQDAAWLSSEAQYKNQVLVIQQKEVNVGTAWQDYQKSTGIIVAPVAGTVIGLKASVGMTVVSGVISVSLATVQSSKQVFGQFQVSEMDISKVRVGQKVELSVPAIPGKTFTGKVSAIDSTGFIKSGVVHFPVIVTINNTSFKLLTNMSADAKIVLSEKDNVLLVPASAVQDNNGTPVVQVIKNGTPTQVPVQTGLSNDTQTEIILGLSLNDTVVTGTQASQTPQNGSASPFGGLSSPGSLAAPGGGNN